MEYAKMQSHEHRLPKETLDQIKKSIYRDADSIIAYFVGAFFVGGVLLSFYYDTWAVGLGVGGLNLAAYLLTRATIADSAIHRYVTSSVFAIFGAQYIYQMHGLFEMHFTLFIIVTIMILYQDYRVLIPLTLIVVVHHTAFAYMQNTGNTAIYFSQLDYISMSTLAFHYGLFVVQVFICGWWAERLRKNTYKEAVQLHQLEGQVSNTENNIRFAGQIANGDLEANYETTEDDTIGKSLLSMRESLKKARDVESQRHWSSQGIAEVEALLRKHDNDMEELCSEIIAYLVKYLGANQGALFISQSDEQDSDFEMKGCYAYSRRKYMSKTFQPGEGLAGQCVLEKEPIYLTEIPQGYMTITSGLGESSPRALLVVPLKSEEKVVGVLEIAGFEQFQEFKREFLAQVGTSIASSLIGVRVNERTQVLLQESQSLTEQMRAQEEEMRQNMEEMQATQEEFERQSQSYEEFIHSVNELAVTIDLDHSGYIQKVSKRMAELSARSEESWIGVHFDQAFPTCNKKWHDLNQGQLSDIHLTAGSTELIAESMPVNDNSGTLKRVMMLGHQVVTEKG
ncbi:GAF domain-containing protein [Roseivirga sp. BDSF3-8]|uniref:GAF domain-containing protein n=1 Tax=Roseivirga sp. BDSF3-8 TaxID=3241598 RepID=UPI003532624B